MYIRTVLPRVLTSNWFCIITLHDWFKNLAQLSHPIRSKTKSNRDTFAHVCRVFRQPDVINFEFWLVHWIFCVLRDWLKSLLWSSFNDTQLKKALTRTTRRMIVRTFYKIIIPCRYAFQRYFVLVPIRPYYPFLQTQTPDKIRLS